MDIPANENSSPARGNYFLKYLDFAGSIITNYNGIEPFHIYLKKYFSANKKHGSKDRKWISSLCYNYFRLGFSVSSAVTLSNKLLLGAFLCDSNPSPLLSSLQPGLNDLMEEHFEKKLNAVKDEFDLHHVFPFTSSLSDKIDEEKFSVSFLRQPKLFIRTRPRQEKKVLGKLGNLNISFEKISHDCLAFSNNEKLTDALRINKEAIIQDYNSQRAGAFFLKYFPGSNKHFNNRPPNVPINIWDCCAGSGGKSLLAFDLLQPVNLTVTDKRENILFNLKKRFKEAAVKQYRSEVLNLGLNESRWNAEFDMLIADVPCSGSGTWSRTPEQLNFFKESRIDEYSGLQKNIVTHALKGLKSNGLLFYITCSVFKKENEENVKYFLENNDLSLIEMEYLKGYEMLADTLFIAVLRKN
ncbi:MAG: Fmu (Sun) domain-containing protein [Ginsengibacter sp.]